MELRTGSLTQLQLQDEVSGIIKFLEARKKWELLVSYGWECDLDMEEMYQEKSLPLSALPDFIAQSIQDGIFTLGASDLYISSDDHSIEYVLCHESDVHMTTQDAELAAEVQKTWTAKNYALYEVPLK